MAKMPRSLAAGCIGAVLVVLVAGSQSEAVRIRKHIEIGSILVEITGDAGKLVGVALLPTGGSYPLPKLASADTSVTVPFFAVQLHVDEDRVQPTIKELDTLLSMTNTASATTSSSTTGATTSGGDLTVKVTFRRADGSAVPAFGNPVNVTIAPGQTVVVSAATFLHP